MALEKEIILNYILGKGQPGGVAAADIFYDMTFHYGMSAYMTESLLQDMVRTGELVQEQQHYQAVCIPAMINELPQPIQPARLRPYHPGMRYAVLILIVAGTVGLGILLHQQRQGNIRQSFPALADSKK